jgi:Domain of unknown function (DUF4234)
LLTVVTLTVYWYVWYYKVNDEARGYLHDGSIKPRMSVLAILPGFLLLFIPVFVSAYRTGGRIELMERQAGVTKTVRPALGSVAFFLTVIAALLLLGGGAYYYQQHLNVLWATRSAANSQAVSQPDNIGQ